MPRFLDLLCGSPAERCDSERRAQMAAIIPAALAAPPSQEQLFRVEKQIESFESITR